MATSETQDQAGYDGHLVALEDVCGYTGAVTHVVSHQVRDDRGVARVILGYPFLDLADEVRAYVSGLGVDVASHPHEKGEQGAAEAEAQEGVGRRFLEDQKYDHAAEQSQPVGKHARDGAGAVGYLEGSVETGARLRGHADIALYGHAHAELPNHEGEESAHHEGDSPSQTHDDQDGLFAHAGKPLHGLGGRLDYVYAEEEGHGQDDHQRDDHAQLAAEVGIRPLADGVPHFLHAGRSLVLFHDATAQHGVGKAHERDAQYNPKGYGAWHINQERNFLAPLAELNGS